MLFYRTLWDSTPSFPLEQRSVELVATEEMVVNHFSQRNTPEL